jgi:hypothetical protein
MAWNYRLDQLLMVYEVMLWIFESKLLRDFFTDPEKAMFLKRELMPLMLA